MTQQQGAWGTLAGVAAQVLIWALRITNTTATLLRQLQQGQQKELQQGQQKELQQPQQKELLPQQLGSCTSSTTGVMKLLLVLLGARSLSI
jgi:hypothetical protein